MTEQQPKQALPLDEGARKKILEYLGIEKVEQEKQDEMIAKIGEVAFKQLFLETMERLDEKQQKAFAKLLEKEASSEDMDAFLREAIPDYDAMAQKVIAELMEDLRTAGDSSKQSSSDGE